MGAVERLPMRVGLASATEIVDPPLMKTSIVW